MVKTPLFKGSGTALATIKPEEFVKMERPLLHIIRTKKYSDDAAYSRDRIPYLEVITHCLSLLFSLSFRPLFLLMPDR